MPNSGSMKLNLLISFLMEFLIEVLQ